MPQGRLNTNAEVLHDLRTVGYNTGSDIVLGETTPDGITIDSQTDETAFKVGSQRGTYLYIPGGVDTGFNFSLVNFSLENVSEAFGIDPAGITGSGTSGSPWILTLLASNYTTQASRTWFGQGLREDGYTVRVEFASAQVFSPQVQIKFTTGEGAAVPFRLRVLGAVTVKLYI